MTNVGRQDIHATTDDDVEVIERPGHTRDGAPLRVPEMRDPDRHGPYNVYGEFAVWLDHSCDEWVIAEGDDPHEVAARVRRFAQRLLEKATAIDGIETVILAPDERVDLVIERPSAPPPE